MNASSNLIPFKSWRFNIAEKPVKIRISRKRQVLQPSKRIEAPEPFHPITIVEAQVDVGWGNTVFIRGQGGELSWDTGIPLACLDNSTWVWLYTRADETITFKLLLNDEIWAEDDDLILAPGRRLEIKPVFPRPTR